MKRAIRMLTGVLFCTLLLPLTSAQAASLILVSDRSAARIVAAVHDYSSHRHAAAIQVRTVSQINQLSDEQLQTLIEQASELLLLAIFAEPVERLLHLRYPAQQIRYAVHGDKRLLSLQQDNAAGRWAELSPARQQQLTQTVNPGSGDVQAFLQQHPMA